VSVPPRDLLERTRLFALAVIEFCRNLPSTSEAQEEAKQLRRAARSVRSNYRAARRGRTRKELQSKLGITFEEADECMDHLRDLRESGIAFDADLFQEARELVLIFAKAVRTARANSQRLKRLPKS
jgi:four helix bundle protein